MDEPDIHRLFMGAVQAREHDTEPVRRVFSSLIRATLAFRDEALALRNQTVTVEHVRLSLDWLPFSLTTGCVPDRIGDLSRGLLEAWIAALRGTPRVELRTGKPE
jgi:hypothetical protein